VNEYNKKKLVVTVDYIVWIADDEEEYHIVFK